MLHAAATGRLSLERAVDLLSTNGAKRFGLYPKKGAVLVGADADLIIADLEATTTIRKSELFTMARECDYLYDGMTFQGKVERTILGGRTVFVDGEVTGEPGWGSFVRPL